MPLTREELRLAAERAEEYPTRHGYRWGSGPLNQIDAQAVAKALRKHPDWLSFGWPALAVAAVRGDVTAPALRVVFRELSEAVCEYPGTLSLNPKAVAQRLRKLAEES